MVEVYRATGRVKAGETIILCERNRPIAEIRPIVKPNNKVRLGLYKGQIHISEDFNEPLRWIPMFGHLQG